MTDPTARDLIQRLADELQGYRVAHPNHEMPALAEARAYLEQTAPVTVKQKRPDQLIEGDIWEFETELMVKGKRKPQLVTKQWIVVGYHHAQCAWQLKSLDGHHYVYLLQYAPQCEEMTYIGTKKND